VKSDPLPPRFTTCGLLAALSVMVNDPVLLPATVGVKVTLMVQLAPAARLEPQVLSCAKLPVATILEMVSAAVPVLVNVTACAALVVPKGWLEKVRLVTDKLTTGAGRPLPASRTTCGESAALSVIMTEPYRFPTAVGEKVTLMLQLAPAARLAGQLLVSPKSPVVVTLVNSRTVLPMFVSVTICAAEVVPTGWLEKVKFVGDKATTAASRMMKNPFSGC